MGWNQLKNDVVIRIFSCLNNRDRTSLSLTCKTAWNLSKSPCLWKTLDLRYMNIDNAKAASIASRCGNLQKLRVCGNESASYIVSVKASNLRDISIDDCTQVTDATLAIFFPQHVALECIQIGPDAQQMITSETIKLISLCCPKLKKLWLTGIKEINGEAISALAHSSRNLTDIGFIDCQKVDEAALGNITTLRFLSIAGTMVINWDRAILHWRKMPNLTCLDVSRTNINPRDVSEFLSSCRSLRVLCSLGCPLVHQDSTSVSRRSGKVLVALFTDILKELSSLFDMPKEKENAFLGGRHSNNLKDRKLEGVLGWLEYIICNYLLCVSKNYTNGLDDFWFHQGTSLLCSFLRSPIEEVQERAAAALATLATSEDENLFDFERSEAVMRENGIHFLVNLAHSWKEVLQLEAVKALLNLSVDSNVAKAITNEGGMDANSARKTIATESLRALFNLTIYEDEKNSSAKAAAGHALVEVIERWSVANDAESVLEWATAALANLVRDDKCSAGVVSMGGIRALEPLLGTGMAQVVQEKAAICLSNMASHDDSSENVAAVILKTGILEALVQLTRSPNNSVRQEAVDALCSLSSDKRNQDKIVAVGGVRALVALAKSCENASNAEEVQEKAAEALWKLASNAGNLMRIIEEDGIPTLIRLCSLSVSQLARFTSALTLTYMFGMRLDELAMTETSSGITSKCAVLNRIEVLKAIDNFLKSCYDPDAFSDAASSLLLPAKRKRVIDAACIEDVDILRCSGSDIDRLSAMLSHNSDIIKSICAFALFQFTLPGGEYTSNHAKLLEEADARRKIRRTACSVCNPREAKAFAGAVLRNLDHRQVDH